MKAMLQKGFILAALVLIGLACWQPGWTNAAYLDLFGYLRQRAADFKCDPAAAPPYRPPESVQKLSGMEPVWGVFRADLARGLVNEAALEQLFREDGEQARRYAPRLIQNTQAACLALQQWGAVEALVRSSEKAGLLDVTLEERLALMFEEQNRPADAVETYARLITLNPAQAAHYGLSMGQQLQRLNQIAAAQAAYAQALQQGQRSGWPTPEEELLTLLLSGDLAIQQNDYPQAIRFYQEIILKDHGARCGDAWTRIAGIQVAQGQDATAIENFQRAIACNASSPWPYLGLGNIYNRRGDTARALRNYELAVAISPQVFDLPKYKKSLGIQP